jgi:MIP family channel proteins
MVSVGERSCRVQRRTRKARGIDRESETKIDRSWNSAAAAQAGLASVIPLVILAAGGDFRTAAVKDYLMNDLKAYIAELVGTFALIFIGVGAIYNANHQHMDLLGIALAQGLTIGVLVSATMAISGGHLNPAITFGALVGGKISASRAVGYVISQLIGATAAGFLCNVILGVDATSAGTPDLGKDVSTGIGILVEAVLTFFLVFVMFGTAIDARAPKIGGLAIGFTVALDVLFGGPLTGAAMNPARTFGPALASGHWANHVVYWIGPLLGGAAAGLIYGRFLIVPPQPAPKV